MGVTILHILHGGLGGLRYTAETVLISAGKSLSAALLRSPWLSSSPEGSKFFGKVRHRHGYGILEYVGIILRSGPSDTIG